MALKTKMKTRKIKREKILMYMENLKESQDGELKKKLKILIMIGLIKI